MTDRAMSRQKSHDAVRKYYSAWDTKNWHALDALLADEFTFSSPLDDHLNKSAFKAGCWDTQIAYIDRFDLKQVMGTDNEPFVMYVCHTTNGKTFRNVEYFQLRDDKVWGRRMLLRWEVQLSIRSEHREGLNKSHACL